jgi:hypothetical protein
VLCANASLVAVKLKCIFITSEIDPEQQNRSIPNISHSWENIESSDINR